MQKPTAMAVGIVDAVDGPLDAVDRIFRKLQREASAGSRRKIDDGVERGFHVRRPVRRFAIFDIVPRPRRRIDCLAQALPHRRIIGVHDCCRHIEPAEQSRILFGQFHDHFDERIDAF
ncbi:hypothetical protein [Bradyrhizobium sp. AZCC 2262]|uniref:hypothetical protein n=1 Tax=Bradyrhizobium sp. AZCC 2262 TaxID=3117022 RepID=UPI002FF0D8C9